MIFFSVLASGTLTVVSGLLSIKFCHLAQTSTYATVFVVCTNISINN